jgi:nucleoid-associated protein YgaU
MNSMRNLEKLGILVIVILVVVVGVVAITPGEQLDRALDLVPKEDVAQRDHVPEVVPPREDPKNSGKSHSANVPPVDPKKDGVDPLPKWPEDPVEPKPNGPSSDPKVVDEPEPEVKPVPAPARPATYTVKKGDSYYRIADKVLGDASLMKALMAANPSIRPEDLDVGDVLILPGRSAPDGGASNSLQRSAQQTPPARETRRAAPIGPGGFYVVRNRDTLVGIAQRELGSSLRWQEIARLNKDVLN